MSIIDQAKEHFSKDNEMLSFEVPEWKTKVFFKTNESVTQRKRWYPLVAANDLEGFVMVLLVRAKNQHGGALFKPQDKEELMNNVDPDVIVRVASQILTGAASEDQAEAEKN